jgi:hypothetical protein
VPAQTKLQVSLLHRHGGTERYEEVRKEEGIEPRTHTTKLRILSG